MTQDEVDLIYEYLHENYEYRDGEFVCLAKKEIKTGIINFGYKNRNACLMFPIKIKQKSYKLAYGHAVWIYHFKQKPKYLKYLDKNIMNNKIENLQIQTRSYPGKDNSHLFKGAVKLYTPIGKKKFRAVIGINNKKVVLGVYYKEKQARQIYLEAKNIYLENNKITNEELKQKIIQKFPWATIRKLNASKKYKGVTQDLRYPNKYTAEICKNYQRIYLGTFETPEEAHAAYLKAKQEHENERT